MAAWISAETGVGPAMASPSQDCSGTWADLPQAPSRSSRPIASTAPVAALGAPRATPAMLTVPKVANMIMMAMDSPMSPTRLTTNAFFAAAAYTGL